MGLQIRPLSLWRVGQQRSLLPVEEMASRTSWPCHQKARVQALGLPVTGPVTSRRSLQLSTPWPPSRETRVVGLGLGPQDSREGCFSQAASRKLLAPRLRSSWLLNPSAECVCGRGWLVSHPVKNLGWLNARDDSAVH